MGSFWEVVSSNAFVASILAAAACLIGRKWRNPAAVHVLWLVVLLKLFTPPILTASLPLGLDRPGPQAPPARAAGGEGPSAGPAPGFVGIRGVEAHPDRPRDRSPESSPEAWEAVAAGGRGWPIATTAAAVWVGVSACLAFGYAVRIRRFARLMRGFDAAPDDTRRLASDLAAGIGLRRAPEVSTTPHTLPPLVWSMGGRPRIVLPSRLFDRLGAEARAAILLHELAHVLRRDHLVRLLELASKVVFWWHPVVWWSCRRLRDLEEECCDGRVLEAAPRQARAYALALLDTSDFLSRPSRVAVPLPTAVLSTSTLSRRIRMLAQPRSTRLKARGAMLVAGFVSLPLVVAFASQTEPRAAGDPPSFAVQDAAKPAAAIVGEVKSEAGAPLADALVRAVVPAMDLRTHQPPAGSRIFEVRTDARGAYRLALPGIDGPATASLDVLKPGFVRSTGAPMRRGDDRRVEVAPGAEAAASFALKPSHYFKGAAVDDFGKPVAGALVHAMLSGVDYSAWVESAETRADGSFELFNYSEDLIGGDEASRGTGRVRITHPDHVSATIPDLAGIPEADRKSIRVVLANGAALSGAILDAAGAPAPNVVIKTNSGGIDGKAATADAQGRFALKGVAKGPVTLSVLSPELGQKAHMTIEVDGDKEGLSVRLESMKLPADPKTYDVLGMKLADLAPEFRNAFELYQDAGALILDPGADPDRLQVGRLARGFAFWMVGNERVGGVRQFVERVVAEAEAQKAEPAPVRVVYEFHSIDGDGTNTQYLKLTKADIDQLKAALEQFD